MQDVICNHIRCGGIDKGQSHRQWLSTVLQSPDVISMSFVPIVSLLSNVPGSGYLSHAINLYMRCKHTYSHSLCHFEDIICPFVVYLPKWKNKIKFS